MQATLSRTMPRPKRPPTTTIRVAEEVASELEVIADYLAQTSEGEDITIGSLIDEWTRSHRAKYLPKAVSHRMDKLERMRQRHAKKPEKDAERN